MNFRLTAALFGIVFVLGTILLIMSLVDSKKVTADTLTAELAAAGVKTEGVDAIEFERPDGGALLIVRTNKEQNTWQIQKPITATADAVRVLPVITALLKAKPTPYSDMTTNPASHGLDPAGVKVTIRAGDKSSTINLGDVTLGEKGVAFVTTSSQSKRPMAVRRSDLEILFREPGSGSASNLVKWTADYRTSNVFPSDARAAGEDVAAVRIELPNKKKELALSRALGGAWRFDSPAGWGDADVEGDAAGVPGTFTGVRRLLGALTSVTAATPGDFIDQPKDLKEYGLNADNPDLVKIVLKTRDNQTVTAYFGKREGTPPPALPPGMPPNMMPPMPGQKVYVRVEGQPGVIRATTGDISGLNGVVLDPAPLRDRTLVNVDRAKVDGIDIVLAGQAPTKLRRTGIPVWRLFGGAGDPQVAYGAPVERLLDVVLARRSIKDFPAPNPANFAAVSATVYVWSDGFTPAVDPKAEPTKKAEPIKVEFGRKDGDTLYVRRTLPGLPPNEFTIPAQVKTGIGTETVDATAAVAKSRLDLLDPSLPTFGSDSVVKVSVSGASSFVLDRDPLPDPSTKEAVWRYASPEPKGRVADTRTLDGLLQLLGTTQSVTRFVDELPTDAKLAEYGFAPAPRLKIVVGLKPDSPDKERVYEFGKDTADPNFVYARVAGKAAVFTLPRLVFDRFVNPDLRDRNILRDVIPSSVTTLELKGWGDAGFVTDLTFEKNKDGIWVATKAPPGFVADPAKVSAFVEYLSKLRVRSFENERVDTKHGFGDPKIAFGAIMRWGNGAAVALNFGTPIDGGAAYYGWSSWLPEPHPVFTVDSAMLKPYRDKPAAFSK